MIRSALSTATAADSNGRTAPSAGHISHSFVSSLHSRPWRITPVPDGNKWVTNTDSAMVGSLEAAAAGRYQFRARLRDGAGGASDWSPPLPVAVS